MATVAAGSYAILAKTVIEPGAGGDVTVVCTLDAGGTSDIGETAFPDDHNGTVSLEVTQTFAATGTIVLRCRSTDTTSARNTKIIAVKVDSTSRQAVTG